MDERRAALDKFHRLRQTRAVLDEIITERRTRAIVPLNGLVFTRDDGRPITKDMIYAQVEKAIKETRVKKFVFHNLRNTALTEWGVATLMLTSQ